MAKAEKKSSGQHTWRFFRAGGFDQVRLDSGQDLLALNNLDQKLWVALACPVDNVHFDSRTLTLIDTDADRRVRAPELMAAVRWALSMLKNPDDILKSSESLLVSAINDSIPEGKDISAAARTILVALGKSEDHPITVIETEAMEKVLSQGVFNGDGVITEAAAKDENVRMAIVRIGEALGTVGDRSGKPGINAEKIEAFFTKARAYDTWVKEAEQDSAIRPLGAATEEAAAAVAGLRHKIDDYFTRCAFVEYDERALGVLGGGDKEYAVFGIKPLTMNSSEITDLPLARVQPRRILSLRKNINPAWAGEIEKLDRVALRPVLGPLETLSESDWHRILSLFAPWFAWQARKPDAALDTIGIGKIRELLAGKTQEALTALVQRDLAEAATFAAMASLEKLVRFHRDLHRLCTNFVSFKDFYSRGGSAIFQAGTLYLDQRSCNLCVKVDDPNKHSLMAAMAGTYLVYCECRRRAGVEKMNIVAAVTNGDSENLIVGRNGIFYDRAGNDWDATIIKIIENPISLRQAFWLPYKSFVRMIESQVAKRASAADAQSTAKLQQTAADAANIDKTKLAPPPKKLDIGIVAALGVAAGALGTFVATLMGYTAGIIRLGPFAIIAAFAGLLLLISGPSLVLAYIKLRKRNLGPILDAGGWALNAKARINVPFGAVLTHVATLPAGAQRDLADPYAEKKSPWPKFAVAAVCFYIAYAALNHLGFVNDWTGGRIGLKKDRPAKSVVVETKTEKPIPASAQE